MTILPLRREGVVKYCSLKKLAAAALIMALSAGSARGEQHPRTIALGGSTWAPIGWVEFCASRFWECNVAPISPRDVVLTSNAWKTLVDINRYVNQRVRPMTDLKHYGVIEKWTFPDD